MPRPELAGDVRGLWGALVERLHATEEHRRLRAILGDIDPLSLAEGVLTVRTHPSLLAATSARAEDLMRLLHEITGLSLRVRVEADAPPARPEHSTTEEDAQRVANHPLVLQTIELLGGRVIGRMPRKRSEETT